MIEVCVSAVREKERELTAELEKKKRINSEIINSQVGRRGMWQLCTHGNHLPKLTAPKVGGIS